MDAEINKCYQCGKVLKEERNIHAYCSVECVHKQARGEERIRELENRVAVLEQIQDLSCECGIRFNEKDFTERAHALYCAFNNE